MLQGKTPYKVLFGKPPTYIHFRCFGCLCYVSTLSRARDKFQPRSKECAFLRYPPNQKGYKILDLESRKIFVSRDLKFYEDQFPFAIKSHLSSLSKLYPLPKFVPEQPESQSIPTSHSNKPMLSLSLESMPSPTPNSPIKTPPPSPPSPTRLPTHPTPIRRSQRLSHKPSYLQDFVCNSILLKDVTTSCFVQSNNPTIYSFGALSIPNQQILHSLSNISDPTSFAEASTHPGWQKAMEAELEALKLNHTWEVVELPPEKKALPCKWVYKVSHNLDWAIERLKARLVVRGDIQK